MNNICPLTVSRMTKMNGRSIVNTILDVGAIPIFMMDTVAAVGALEMALRRFGHPLTLGTGVAAAQEVFMESLPR